MQDEETPPEDIDRTVDFMRAAAAEPGHVLIPWPDLPEYVRNYWRELAKGNAGASLG